MYNSDTKTGKIHFIASCPYSDHDKFLSLAEALQVAIHLHTLSWKALASAVEYSERKKTVKRTRALTPSILPSIQTRISENISTPIQNASIQSESGAFIFFLFLSRVYVCVLKISCHSL